jgi:hypothetical protein
MMKTSTTINCAWCNCEIRGNDKNNPITNLYYDGKIIHLHELCKDTFFEMNPPAKKANDYFNNLALTTSMVRRTDKPWWPQHHLNS